MIGLGTIINVGTIVFGGLLGLLLKKSVNKEIKEMIITVLGVCVMAMSAFSVFSAMVKLESENALLSNGTLVMVITLVLGTVIGYYLNVERAFVKFGNWLKKKTKSENDQGFLHAFLVSSYTVSIGAMALIGSINDGMQINGGYTLLLVKGILDGVFILVMTSSLGKGCIFSAIPVAVFQGVMTVIAYFIGDFMTVNATLYLSLVGNVLIFCIGINLVFGKNISIASMLPSIILAIACGFFI